jgi:glycosyltransferase involved in cell wall biosynthesis
MNKKMTFLVSDLSHGGAEKVCVTLCNEFVNLGYQTELWIVKERKSALIQQLDKRIDVFNLKKEHARESLFPLLKLLIQQKPERILVFHIQLAIIVIVLKKIFFLKTKIIVRSINTLSHEFKNTKGSLRKNLTMKLIKFILPYADKIVAQSTGMHDDLLKLLKIDGSKIVTVFNPAMNISVKESDVVEKSFGESEFLFVGRLSEQKGLINLLKAFKMASDKNSKIHLTLVGDGYGSQMEMLKNLVVNMKLSSLVTFEGYQENTIKYFKRAKATLLTSFFEGFPNVLVESIAVGTPVISFNCPSGPEDIIVKGVNGILVPHLDVDEFANAILAVANDKIQFKKEEIIDTAKRFSTDVIVNNYEKVFGEI